LSILIIIGEEYELWGFSLCSFLQPPVTSSLCGTAAFCVGCYSADSSVVVEALCYKPEDRGFEIRWRALIFQFT
jgi:hypothetical protein